MLGKVRGVDVTAPNLTGQIANIRELVSVCRSYVNTIDSEDVKLFVNSKLVALKQRQSLLKIELEKITDPLVESRRQALTAKQAAENLFAPAFADLEIGERILKNEILRWVQLVERERLRAEAELRQRAEAEQRRLLDQARAESERIARENMAKQQEAVRLENEGKTSEAQAVRDQAASDLEIAAEEVQWSIEEADAVVHNAIVPTSSVKMAGTSITGRWFADVIDPFEVIAGIVDKSTPPDALRVKINGRLVPVPTPLRAEKIEGIEINLPWFQEKAREQGERFSYRGMKARYEQNLRVIA